jgi:hypothetical protein
MDGKLYVAASYRTDDHLAISITRIGCRPENIQLNFSRTYPALPRGWETFDAAVDQVDSIYAIDKHPHGIFGVDMTYDDDGFPNTTEINIGRFFTTHYFFTKAGLNFPKIYCDIALDGKFPNLQKRINPLPDGLIWIRGMDVEPVLTTRSELDAKTIKHP